MKKIIKIQSGNRETLKITWQMTTNCVYACEYCPAHFRTGKHLTIDLDFYKKFFSQFTQPIYIGITGGEVTTHPQFIDVLTMLRSLGIKIRVDSNNVRTARFYKEVADLADVWCLTMHPSQHKFDIEKIKVLTDHSFVIVYVMMDPNHWDLANSWIAELKSLQNIKVILIKPVDNWAGANYTYQWSPEQLELLDTPPMWQFTKERFSELEASHSWLKDTDTVAVYNDGSTSVLDPDQLMKLDTNKFLGWTCFSGRENLLITPEGNISWSNCGMIDLGNVKDFDINQWPESVICNRARCDCGADIRADKHI
jgi:MoaA/NifB/PqqE/SkfB family radical SAM enzyme